MSSATANITIKQPIYLLKTQETCYQCGEKTDVFCISASHLIDHSTEFNDEINMSSPLRKAPLRLSNLSYLDSEFRETLAKYASSYYLDYTKQGNSRYYVNHCKCGAKLGDFYLINEANSVFNPLYNDALAKNITMYELPIFDSQVKANYIAAENDFAERVFKEDYLI
ncbi:hypothetical protein [uncultured Gammaproteobacteria bacterium]|uniref:hypothetical protein n=1 Tax=Bathymodiolus heckerae thiotrophic gill symbiont TaxID=1052212 RepID=UPI0010B72A8D|nr:hypothetical protein [Bathymodiolus heckerae thiotrophic gill symbiont]CAC9579200.1 hypothetical protein [uncultured Gammaproteobacteria bacterium]CAC9587921.1 hypothetical protein [uncultured Gammaproteobacteria bacterium]CAC9949949.1 hypothetical protein [uncultured Gammaproteobacteria bacterium]CAC9957857.1 hypothetical protein [uncultured Gammaproteobacteria bacterium]SHN93182.1 hypothetical protein BHECKSOX_2288 [Bathymodiolus heckerae thiotrophic gill symbiont]